MSTVAIASSFDSQVTFLLVALLGDTVAMTVSVAPTVNVVVDLLTVIALTATVFEELPPPPLPPPVLGAALVAPSTVLPPTVAAPPSAMLTAVGV